MNDAGVERVSSESEVSASARSSPAATVARPHAAIRRQRLHLKFGWIGLLTYALLGIILEALHAWKSPAYLGVGNETRRLVWTLAHAHGVGLSLVHLGFAATLGIVGPSSVSKLELASRALNWGSVLIPLGFFLGGVVTYEADPGVGVFLVPFGALALVIALVRVVWVLVSEKERP